MARKHRKHAHRDYSSTVFIIAALVAITMVVYAVYVITSGAPQPVETTTIASTAAATTTQITTTTAPTTTVQQNTTTVQQNTTNSLANNGYYFGQNPVTIRQPIKNPFGYSGSPYSFNVYMSESTNGLNWTAGQFVFNYSYAPGALYLPSNTILVYYTDGTNTIPSGIIVARSTNSGKTWFKYGVVLNGVPSGLSCNIDPEPALVSNVTIRLYVACYATNGTLSTLPYIGSATSLNGVVFTMESGVRVSTPRGQVPYTNPDVIGVYGLWVMYLSQGALISAFTSTNGQTFGTKSGYVFKYGGDTSSILLPNSLTRHYFCPANGGIYSATSVSPTSNWTQEPGVRIPLGSNVSVCDPSVIDLSNGTYVMFYDVQP